MSLFHLHRTRDALLRGDLSSFIARSFRQLNPSTRYLPNWHIDAIAQHLEAAQRRQITRLLINMPPRALKSHCVSVTWPAYLMGHDPATKIMAASYAQSLSTQHSLECRSLMGARWYQRVFPQTRLKKDQNEKHKFATTSHGVRIATSVGGAATGEGGDFLIVDDPLSALQGQSKSARDAANHWFSHTFASRLNDKERGVIVVVMQRLHEEDLAGHLLARGGWELLKLPAIAPQKMVVDLAPLGGRLLKIREAGDVLHESREGEKLLARAKAELGSRNFAAQYQQEPVPDEGGMVKLGWFGCHRHCEERSDEAISSDCGGRLPQSLALLRNDESFSITQSWDTAIKSGPSNDPSVCITFAEMGGVHYVLDVHRARLEYPELKRAAMRLAEEWKPQAMLIEDKASGQSLLQDLRRESALPVIAINPRGDKLTRFAAVTPLIEAGKVSLPHEAPWLAEFEHEMMAFPQSAHDDQVDALSQYLNWVRGKQNGAKMGIRRL